MTKQTWTATVSAVLFVVLAAVIALVPVPYVLWSPGGTSNLLEDGVAADPITITGTKTFPTTGKLLMTTVAVTSPESTLSLPEVLFSYWLPSRQVLPRSAVYREGQDPTDITQDETQLMTDSQSDAVVAALREAGIPVISWPMVQSVTSSGPANDILKPGDLIQAVDGRTTTSVQDVEAAVAAHHVGEAVLFTVMRDGQVQRESVTTRATTANPDKPVVGISLTTGYTYKPSVKFAIDPAVGGSSAGLMFALAISDKLSDDDLTAGRVIAGTGTMAADGTVGPIGGAQEKVAAAARDGATIFVLPRDNCVDVGQAPSGIRLVPVDSLDEAISALRTLQESPDTVSIAGCS
ncbi:MAG: PDZ domain-containing protein [Propionicimonas sp.]|uniref:YlbL family protein n=1 Tax=Propionicimonas sp. TaxID=1955623 RepID=UPI003D146846